MTDRTTRLSELGITLPPAPQPNATYVPTTQAGDVLYVSGQLAFDAHGNVPVTGKLGLDHDVASGRQQARVCALNLLAQLPHALGDLARVEQLLKLHVYVAAVPASVSVTRPEMPALDDEEESRGAFDVERRAIALRERERRAVSSKCRIVDTRQFVQSIERRIAIRASMSRPGAGSGREGRW